MTYFKMLLNTALTAMVISVMLPTMVFAAASGTVTGFGVNIRSEANEGADIVGQGNKGSELILLGKTGTWFQVSFDGNSNSFISQEFFKVTRAEGTVNDVGVNVRSGPSTESDIIKQVTKGDVLTVIAQNDDWYQLAFNDGGAYLSKKYLSGDMLGSLPQMTQASSPAGAGTTTQAAAVSNTYGVVTASGNLRVRSAASTDTPVIANIYNGDVMDVLEIGNPWLKVKLENGTTGYVSSEFVAVRTGEKPSRSNAGNKGDQVVTYAKKYLGTPYTWGGTTLGKGVDCSGFVYAVMKNFGVSLNRSSAGMYSNGVAVNKADIMPGDLVFFAQGGNGSISHVGIYTGNGEYIHSSTENTGVIMSQLNSGYSASTYAGARRVLR